MKLHSIELERYRSFRHKAVFKMPQPGLVYVSGRNDVSPDLGANGIGKSTLFEAIQWCCFGKTSRGLKAGNIANWQEPKAVTVCIKGEAFGKLFTVMRGYKPNVLTLNGKEVDQIELEKALGISEDTFNHAFHFAQFTTPFLDLKPEPKMQLLVDVLDLHIWHKASDTAKKTVEELWRDISRIEGEISGIAGTLEVVDLEKIAKQEREWSESHKAKLKEWEDKKKQVSPATKEQAKAQLKQVDQLQAGHTELVRTQSAINAEKRMHKKRLDEVSIFADGECPTCGAEMDKEHQQKEIGKIKALMAACDAKLETINEAMQQQKRYIETAKAMLAKMNESVEVLNEYQAQIEALTGQANPYTEQRKKAEADRVRLKLKLAALNKELAALKEEQYFSQYWVKGFKEVRLLVVDSVLAQLEAEVNQTIQQLGLAGWQIKFDVEKETKSGNVSRGFTTMVLSPANSEPVPWEAWSGGESQRLRLAGTMGFANLIHAHTGLAPNFELWDEPSTWMADVGIEQMLQTLNDRARRYKRAVLVADHRALSYGGFSERVYIVKGSEGSRFEGSRGEVQRSTRPPTLKLRSRS